MALKLTCPACTAPFGLGEDARGETVFCPRCGKALLVTNEGVAKAIGRPASAHAASTWKLNPLYQLIAVPLLLLIGGLSVYLVMHRRTDEHKEVAKHDGGRSDEYVKHDRDPQLPQNDPALDAVVADHGSLKSGTRMVDDLKVATLNLPSKGLLPCMLWADVEGSAFLALDGDTGILRRIGFPNCKVMKQKQLDGKFAWMSLSAEGLLLSDPGSERILVVDPGSLEQKAEIVVAKLKRADSAPGQSWAVACDQGPFHTQKLYFVDLVKRSTVAVTMPQRKVNTGFQDNPTWQQSNTFGADNPIVTPDGAYVFTRNNDFSMTPDLPALAAKGLPTAYRFSFNDGNLKYEESDAIRGIGGFSSRITLSPDSKLVCLNWQNSTTIYPVDSFKKQACALELGLMSPCVGFDIKGGYIYGQNLSHDLVLFTPHGAKRKEYTLEKSIMSWPRSINRFGVVIQEAGSRPWQEGDTDGPGPVQQYLVYPGGNQVVLLTATALYAVEVPKQN